MRALVSLALFAAERYKQGQEPQHADNHGERVVVDVTGLEEADHAGEPADEACAAVHDTVDDDHIAFLPETTANCHSTPCKHDFVDLVHVVLVIEQRIDRAE